MTTTLYNFIRSELQKKGLNEFVDTDGRLLFFDSDSQFLTKIMDYDQNVSDIMDHVFNGMSLDDREHDEHFKKTFLFRFLERQINRQTIEAFKVQLMMVFLTQKDYINRVYSDLENYITGSQESNQTNRQENRQSNDGTTTTDNRQAYSQLPQNNVQIDVDNTVMDSANDNTISRNKQTNNQRSENETSGETTNTNKQYQLDSLIQSSVLMEQIFDEFDRKCFMQFW